MPRRRATEDLPGSGGVLLPVPEDFEVEEALPYPLDGAGPQLFVRIEKRGRTTPEAGRHLAAALDAPAPSWAGLKDRASIARQWLSLPWPEARPAPEPGPIGDGLSILASTRHGHRLKTGHVKTNRFRIRLRSVPPGGFERARAVAARLAETGLPNRFGRQRFGRREDNVASARAILSGARRRPRDRRLEKLLMSALQAELFNQVLDRRLEDGSWRRARPGDLMKKHDSGGLFVCEDPALDQPRVETQAISPTGPMFGKRMRAAQGEVGELETAIWAEGGVQDELRRRLGDGTRRLLRVPVQVELHPAEEGYWAVFTLPSGSYATVVLDELVKPEEGEFRRAAQDGPPQS
ncbi:MAG: tRNA pseudouridine(13) synthase TruD [Myxococcota bacterium]